MGVGVDFVVFGFGLGAILMLVGFALRDLGPWLFGSTRHDEALPEFEGAKTTIRKQTLSSIGNAISLAGAGVAAVTFSALLAKADDDLGAIVVGMSLVLATVGVGAWAYDVFRRYRAALDIVATQEEAVRQRLAPRQKRRRPRPAPQPRPADQDIPTETTVGNQPQPDEPVAAGGDVELVDRPSASEEPDEPDVSGDAPEDTPGIDPNDTSFYRHERAETPPVDPTNRPMVSRIHPGRQDQREPDLASEELPVAASENVPAAESVEAESPLLPPLPEPADDTLIDESVRLEPRPEPGRQLPSWLFEDLETDLASGGANPTNDPIDHFQKAKPVTRPSALNRLLSDEGTGDDSADTADGPQPRRPMGRDDD